MISAVWVDVLFGGRWTCGSGAEGGVELAEGERSSSRVADRPREERGAAYCLLRCARVPSSGERVHGLRAAAATGLRRMFGIVATLSELGELVVLLPS
jgi:hypothetical protein